MGLGDVTRHRVVTEAADDRAGVPEAGRPGEDRAVVVSLAVVPPGADPWEVESSLVSFGVGVLRGVILQVDRSKTWWVDHFLYSFPLDSRRRAQRANRRRCRFVCREFGAMR